MTMRYLVHNIFEAHKLDRAASHRLGMLLLWITGTPRYRGCKP